MRSIKSSSGLKRGRGITESTLQLWLRSMHSCADIHGAMWELTGAYGSTNEPTAVLKTRLMKMSHV